MGREEGRGEEGRGRREWEGREGRSLYNVSYNFFFKYEVKKSSRSQMNLHRASELDYGPVAMKIPVDRPLPLVSTAEMPEMIPNMPAEAQSYYEGQRVTLSAVVIADGGDRTPHSIVPNGY